MARKECLPEPMTVQNDCFVVTFFARLEIVLECTGSSSEIARCNPRRLDF